MLAYRRWLGFSLNDSVTSLRTKYGLYYFSFIYVTWTKKPYCRVGVFLQCSVVREEKSSSTNCLGLSGTEDLTVDMATLCGDVSTDATVSQWDWNRGSRSRTLRWREISPSHWVCRWKDPPLGSWCGRKLCDWWSGWALLPLKGRSLSRRVPGLHWTCSPRVVREHWVKPPNAGWTGNKADRHSLTLIVEAWC